MNRLIVFTMLCLSAGSAFGSETWNCTQSEYTEDVLLTATIHDSKTTGQIEVAGTTHTARYLVEGFDRRWDFGLNDGSYTYAFVISPDGDGLYYDFSKTISGEPTSAKGIYHCTQQ